MKNYFKRAIKQKGITLIALVITVIVLLILSGTAISISTSEDGIFTKTDKSNVKWNNGTLKEDISLAMIMYHDETGLKEKLGHIAGAEIEKVQGRDDAYLITKGNSKATVYADGDILIGETSVWGGNSDIKCPTIVIENGKHNWYINSAAELKFLADFINNGNSLTGTANENLANYVTGSTENIVMEPEATIFLMKNIDLGARPGEGATEEEKWENNTQWTPIGAKANYVTNILGTFDGNNYTIKGVYVNQGTDNYLGGLFKYSNSIKNLTIKDSYVKGNNGVGGIVGVSINGIVENCHNNNSTVIGLGRMAGGIVAYSQTSIEKCTNSGNINGNSRLGRRNGRIYTQI